MKDKLTTEEIDTEYIAWAVLVVGSVRKLQNYPGLKHKTKVDYIQLFRKGNENNHYNIKIAFSTSNTIQYKITCGQETRRTSHSQNSLQWPTLSYNIVSVNCLVPNSIS